MSVSSKHWNNLAEFSLSVGFFNKVMINRPRWKEENVFNNYHYDQNKQDKFAIDIS